MASDKQNSRSSRLVLICTMTFNLWPLFSLSHVLLISLASFMESTVSTMYKFGDSVDAQNKRILVTFNWSYYSKQCKVLFLSEGRKMHCRL